MLRQGRYNFKDRNIEMHVITHVFKYLLYPRRSVTLLVSESTRLSLFPTLKVKKQDNVDLKRRQQV
jgi:hypothetical protein